MCSLTVYTTPDCMQCTMTCRKLEKAGLTYLAPSTSAPTPPHVPTSPRSSATPGPPSSSSTRTRPTTWSGFRPDLIAALSWLNTTDASNTTITGKGSGHHV